MKRFSAIFGISLLAVGLLATLSGCSDTPDNVVRLGAGSYTTARPASISPPLNADGSVAVPMVSPDLDKPVTTHEFWSSLLWPHANPWSVDMWAHPLLLRADANGLHVGHPTTWTITDSTYFADPVYDIHLGVTGLSAPETRVADYGDWSVTAEWPDSTGSMHATFGRGLPWVWVSGGTPSIRGGGAAWRLAAGTAVLELQGKAYAAFLPPTATWRADGDYLTADAQAYAVAVLPNADSQTVELYARYAMSRVVNTEVAWDYNQESARVTTDFTFETQPLLPGLDGPTGTLSALYPHQWKHSAVPLTDYSYWTPRGIMRVMEGSSFETSVLFEGALPRVSDLCLSGGDDRLRSLLDETVASGDAFVGNRGQADTYWSGKAMGRLSELVSLAAANNLTEARDTWGAQMTGRLESWLSAEDPERLYYYDSTWKTLVGAPASFGTDTDLNDHHFHYGYHIQAAAAAARLDTTWADRWGAMVDFVIKDAANADRNDVRFPFLRSFDPYAGHGVANGHTNKVGGYDQESSSEAMNFAAALIQWGAETGDHAVRDLGVWLYATEQTAIESYWFDIDNQVFPPDFDHSNVAIVWGRGGAYTTWWSPKPEFIHGINYLPLTGGSYYLGRHPDYILQNDRELQARTGRPDTWQDLSAMFLALADPDSAIARFETFSDTYAPEDGESKAHTWHWLNSLAQVGTPDTTVTANIPTYRVFHNGARRAYAAYNPSGQPIRVRFSDGAEFRVPPRRQITVCR